MMMGSTWESLINALIDGRDADYRTEPERDQARRDNLEWIVQTMLEKLRDEEQAQSQLSEPDVWQWRACIGGQWGSWLILDQPVEKFRESQRFNLDNGTYELRPLYARSPDEGMTK
jgi:hypothetical protein